MDADKKSLTPLKDVIGSLLNDSLPLDMRDARIWEVWDGVAGPAAALHARPLWVKGGHLRVMVSDSIWLQEMRFRERGLVRSLNEELGRRAVERMTFRLGLKEKSSPDR